MFENVIVGVDGRAGGRDAIALASRLAAPGATLTLVHIHSGELYPLHALTPGLVAHEHDASVKLLQRERAAAGVEAELRSAVSFSPGRGLHQQAEAHGADLLVVGSCSRGVFGRAMLGNDTRSALNGASCAVAIAARGYATHPLPLAKVGVGYNGSAESRAALELARELAAPSRAAVAALEVVSIPTYAFAGLVPAVMGESLEALLEEANGRMHELPAIEGRAVCGLAGEELAAFGNDLDILLIGSRSYGPVRRLVLGSTADYLERHAHCSLLVLPRVACKPAADMERQPSPPLGAGEAKPTGAAASPSG